jgi:transcriptional regulator with XRE-family HTH domain
VPPFYASVELIGIAVPEAAVRPAIQSWDLSGNPRRNTRGQGIVGITGSLFSLQNSRTDSGVTYLELHSVSHPLKVVQLKMVMKRKTRRPNSADIQIGESIRAHRLIVGMSQSDLGRRLGVSFQQIQKYEKGMNRVGAGRLPQIAKIFGISVGALFDANAVTSLGESTRLAPVKLIPDRNTLKLLTAFGGIAQGKIRHSLVGLVDAIAKAAPKMPR